MSLSNRRCRQLVRSWDVLVALRRRGYTINMLAEKFDCTTRTIRRDLEALQVAGFPIEPGLDDEGNVFWRLRPQREWPAGERMPIAELPQRTHLS